MIHPYKFVGTACLGFALGVLMAGDTWSWYAVAGMATVVGLSFAVAYSRAGN